MTLTDPVLEDIRRAATCWFASQDSRGRPLVGARDAWAVLGDGRLALADRLSPATGRNLRVNPWAVAGFMDGTGSRGWRVEGPARSCLPGEPGFAEAALHLAETGAERPKRVLLMAPVRVERLLAPEMPLLPDRASKGIAMIRAALRARELRGPGRLGPAE